MARSPQPSPRRSRADPAPGAGPVPARPPEAVVAPDRGSGAVHGAPHPLLVVCALGIERFALRAAEREGAAGSVALLRTGMGPRAAEGAVREALLTRDALRSAAVLATGFCAGLAPGLRPGDIVVDERSDAAGVLADALGRRLSGAPGRTAVHTGRIAESDHVVRGAERASLAAAGAVAVDMESAAVRRAALAAGPGPRPVAAVRVVVDTPEYELVRMATVRTGITAFRVLRSVLPALLDWHRSNQLPWR